MYGDSFDASAGTHPLVDVFGPGWAASFTSSPLVWLNRARMDLLLRAARHGDRLLIVSKPGSRLTEPMRDTLTTLGGHWLVQDPVRGLYDGLSGQVLASLGDALMPSDDFQVCESFMQPGRYDEMQFVVSWSIRHKAEAATVVGRSVEAFLEGLGLGAPQGWGLQEPVTEPWNAAELTRFARSRMPEPSRLVVTGGGDGPRHVLTVMVQRTNHGVEELVTGLVGAGPVDSPAANERLAMIVPVLAGMCEGTMPLFGLVMARSGRADLSYEAVVPGAPMPVAMLIGPPGVRDLQVDIADAVDRWGVFVAGRPRLPALVYGLLPKDAGDATRLPDILAGFDQDRLQAVLGHSAPLAQGGR
ncbi:MAG: DUF6177 family protein [Propionibacteriaceae bacterium]|nr:DUF6177 family protein [Propionibacteriaceae bacterium]